MRYRTIRLHPCTNRLVFSVILLLLLPSDGLHHNKGYTVNFLNIRTPQKFIVITLKFELCGSTIE